LLERAFEGEEEGLIVVHEEDPEPAWTCAATGGRQPGAEGDEILLGDPVVTARGPERREVVLPDPGLDRVGRDAKAMRGLPGRQECAFPLA